MRVLITLMRECGDFVDGEMEQRSAEDKTKYTLSDGVMDWVYETRHANCRIDNVHVYVKSDE